MKRPQEKSGLSGCGRRARRPRAGSTARRDPRRRSPPVRRDEAPWPRRRCRGRGRPRRYSLGRACSAEASARTARAGTSARSPATRSGGAASRPRAGRDERGQRRERRAGARGPRAARSGPPRRARAPPRRRAATLTATTEEERLVEGERSRDPRGAAGPGRRGRERGRGRARAASAGRRERAGSRGVRGSVTRSAQPRRDLPDRADHRLRLGVGHLGVEGQGEDLARRALRHREVARASSPSAAKAGCRCSGIG